MAQSVSPTKYVLLYLKKDRARLASTIFWAVLFAIIPMQVPILTGALIDGLQGKHVGIYGVIGLSSEPGQVVSYTVIGLIIIAALYGITAHFRISSRAKLSRHVVSELRKALLQKFEVLSLDIHTKYGSGELLSRAILDTQSLRPFIERGIIKTSISIAQICYPLVMLFILDFFLASLASSILPIQWVITRALQRKLHRASRRARKAQAKFTTVLKESLDGIETIQTSNVKIGSIKRMNERAERLESDEIQTQKYAAMIAGVVWGLTSLGIALIWWQGGLKVLAGEMTVGSLIAFTGLTIFLYQPMRSFTRSSNAYQKGLVAAERIHEVLDKSSSIHELPNAVDLEIRDGKTEFRNVSFSYPQSNAQHKVLDNINLTFEPNKLICIVGKSGAGKSSLMKLITRLYDPSEGQILIDSQDIKKVKLESLRSQIAVVPQTPIIFSGTVSENIRLARPDAIDSEVEEACRSADALKFILDLDQGFNTRLGQGGVNLSGGEIQRIAIARALIRKPKILLLDEPSSALDLESQSAIISTLDRLKSNMTIILVGHHLKAMSKADRLIIIDNGKVVEDGTHKELISSRGLYSLLYIEDGMKEK